MSDLRNIAILKQQKTINCVCIDRGVIKTASDVIEECCEKQDSRNISEGLMQKMFNTIQRDTKSKFREISSMLDVGMDTIEQICSC